MGWFGLTIRQIVTKHRCARSRTTIAIAVVGVLASLTGCSSPGGPSRSPEASDAVSDANATDVTPEADGSGERRGWVSTRLSPDGTSTVVVTSTDGLTWNPVGTVAAQLLDLAEGPDGWIAVGSALLGTTTVYASADLRSWQPVATLDGYVRALAFGGDRFVAVGAATEGAGAERPLAHWSTDGTTWSTVDLPAGLSLSNTPTSVSGGLAHTGTEFVAAHTEPAAADDGPLDLRAVVRRYRSPDGVTWTAEDGSEVLAGGTRVALAPGPDSGSLLQAVELPGDEPIDGVSAPAATDAVTLVDGAGATVQTSDPDVPLADHPADEIAYDGSTYLVLSTGPAGYNGDTLGPDVFLSTDGLTYEHLGQVTGHLGNVAYGTIGPATVTTGDEGWVMLDRLTDSPTVSSEVLVSTDGREWTEVSEIPENALDAADRVQGVGQVNISALIQGPTGWLAFGVGHRSNGLAVTLVQWSPDLGTWTTVAEIDGHVLDVAHGDGRYVAVGTADAPGSSSGAVEREPLALASTDGLAWERAELQVADATALAAVAHVSGHGFLAAATGELAVGSGAPTGEPTMVRSVRSADGSGWSTSTEPPRAAAGGSVSLAAADGAVIQVAVPSSVGGTTSSGATASPITTAVELLAPDGTVTDSMPGTPFEGSGDPFEVHRLARGDSSYLAISADEHTTLVRSSRDGRNWTESTTLDGTVSVVLAHGRIDPDPDRAMPDLATTAPAATEPPATVAPTTTPPAPETSPPPAPSGARLGNEPTFHDDRASGSGCSPGQGGLPDGWWFGFARSAVSAGASFELDLACYYTGSIGEQRAREAGLGFTGFVITNDNATTRPVLVDVRAAFRCVDPSTHEQASCANPGSSGFPVWVRIVGGQADKVVDQYVH